MCVFIQVLRLLEDVGLPELVIQLASLAITEAVNDVNSQVTLSTQVNSVTQYLVSSTVSIDLHRASVRLDAIIFNLFFIRNHLSESGEVLLSTNINVFSSGCSLDSNIQTSSGPRSQQ